MAALTGNKIKDSYLGLLKTTNSGILTSNFVRITDGGGNNTQLYLSNAAIRFYDAYTFPSADGTVGQVLTTDANGALSWADSSDNQTLDEVLTQGNTTDLAILSGADGNTFGSTTFDAAVTGTTANFTTSVTSPDFIGDLNGSVRFAARMIGSSVLKGQVVYVSGLSGNTPEVQLAKADSTTTMTAVGIAADDANENASFEVDTLGSARGIDLSDCIETGITLTEGDVLYVSATEAGHLTNVAPTGVANLIQNIGMAIRVDPTTNATIKVMGAGRANALPNLPTGVIVGNGTSAVSASSNLLIASDGTITLYQPNNVPSDIKNYNIGGGNIALNTDGFNTGFGEGNLSQVGFVGSNNSAFGYQSSFSITTGDNNTSVGFSSLLNETVGVDNTAIGNYSLFYSNNGNFNTAIGSYSLYANTLGGQNVALGYQALNFNTTSSHNTALGFRALRISTGDHNLGVGYNSGNAIATGNNNVVIGSNTGSTIDGLSNRIIISDGAANIRQLIDNVGKLQMPDYGSGTHTGTLAKTLAVDSSGYVIEVDATTGTVTSVALSVPTGLTVTGSPITTSGTIAIGGTLGVANGGTGATTLTGILVGNGTSAISVVSDGIVSGQVLSTNANGTYSFIDAAGGDVTKTGGITANQIAVWNDSTDELRSDETVTIGTDHSITLYQPNTNSITTNYIIGGGSSMTTGQQNTGFGSSVLTLNTTGVGNVAIGSDSLTTNVSGNNNVAIGLETLKRTTASDNIAIGSRVLQFDTTGYKNTAIGGLSQYNITTAYGNTSLGYNSLIYNSTGIQNTAIGLNSLKGVSTYSASNNTAIGYNSGSAITTGSYNVIIGSNTGSTIATSSSNIIISDGSGTIRQSFDFTGAATFNGAATFSGNVTASGGYYYGQSTNSFVRLDNTIGSQIGYNNYAYSLYDSNGVSFYTAVNATPTLKLNISTGGDVIQSSGNLIIKNANGDSNGLKLFQDVSDVSVIENHYSGSMKFNIAGSTKLTISSTGAATFSGTSVVGVTVANTNYAIGEAYNSFGNLNIYTTNAEAQNMGGSLTLGGTGAGGVYSYAAIYGKKESAGVGSALGYLAFATDNNSNLVERMRITSGGNVGIGTDSPSFYGLSFKNIVTISSAAATTDYAIIELAGGSAAGGGIQFGNQTVRQAGIFSLNGSDLGFYTNSTNSGAGLTEAMRISSGGTISNSNFSAASNPWIFENIGTNPYGAWFKFTTDANNSSNYYWVASALVSGSETIRAKMLSNGGLANYSGNNVNLASDIRLKKDIVNLPSEWDRLKQIKVVNYRYKDSDEERVLYGAIAQQVQEIYPNLVEVTVEATKTKPEYFGLREQPFQWLTTKVLQEAMTKIESQQTIIEDLKSRIEKLEG